MVVYGVDMSYEINEFNIHDLKLSIPPLLHCFDPRLRSRTTTEVPPLSLGLDKMVPPDAQVTKSHITSV